MAEALTAPFVMHGARDAIAGGLSTAIQGICELRNQCGFASHGSGTPRNGPDIAPDMPRSSGQGRCTSTNQR